MTAVVDVLRGVPAAAEHAVGAGEHPVDALAGAGKRAEVGQVPGDRLGAERREIGRPLGMPVQRPHRFTAFEQPHHRAAQRAGGADDECLHGGAPAT